MLTIGIRTRFWISFSPLEILLLCFYFSLWNAICTDIYINYARCIFWMGAFSRTYILHVMLLYSYLNMWFKYLAKNCKACTWNVCVCVYDYMMERNYLVYWILHLHIYMDSMIIWSFIWKNYFLKTYFCIKELIWNYILKRDLLIIKVVKFIEFCIFKLWLIDIIMLWKFRLGWMKLLIIRHI